MGFAYSGYETLKRTLINVVREYTKKYSVNGTPIDTIFHYYGCAYLVPELEVRKIESDEGLVPGISADRKMQVGFILTTINCLDTLTASSLDEPHILHALAFYFYYEIKQSYDPNASIYNYLCAFWVKDENSNLLGLLQRALNLTKDNYPSNKELLKMFGTLKKFILAQIKEENNPYINKIEEEVICQFVLNLCKQIGVLDGLVSLEEIKSSMKTTQKIVVLSRTQNSLSFFKSAEATLDTENTVNNFFVKKDILESPFSK